MFPLRLRRSAVLLIAAVLSLGTLLAPPPAHAADPAVACLEAGRVWVVVDDGTGAVTGGCATDGSSGLAALTSAGFTVVANGGFVCQINGQPTTCDTSNKDWWSYFHRSQTTPGTFGAWEFSEVMASQYKPLAGSIEGWRLASLNDSTWPPKAPAYTPPAITPPDPDTSTPVTIPDAGFRTCLNETLGQPANATLTTTSLGSITQLECFYADIADLTGAQHLTNATSIKLEMNKISDISPLAGLTKLTTLSLDSNLVADASVVSTLTSLASLDLDYNRLTTLQGLSQATSLVDLRVGSQQIAKVPTMTSVDGLTSLTALRTLDISSNGLVDLAALKGLRLTTLLAYGNKVTDLTPVGSITTLTELNVHTNPLSGLDPLAGLTSLAKLNARSAGLTSVGPLPTLPAITVVDLGRNPLTDAPRLRTATTLTDVGLESTGLTDAAWLADLPALTWFIGHSNQITNLSALQGKTMRGWGALSQVVPVNATAGVGFALPTLVDQTGDAIAPSVPKGVTASDGSYTATAPGTYTFAFSEKKNKSAKFAGKIVVTVTPAVAPAFTQGPSDTTAQEGDSVTFTAVASGDPSPTITWETSTDGTTWAPATVSTTAKNAATSTPTFTIGAASLAQDGLLVRATATNLAGSVTSSVATLSVTPRPVVVPGPEPTPSPTPVSQADGSPSAQPQPDQPPLAAAGAPSVLPLGVVAAALLAAGVTLVLRRGAGPAVAARRFVK